MRDLTGVEFGVIVALGGILLAVAKAVYDYFREPPIKKDHDVHP